MEEPIVEQTVDSAPETVDSNETEYQSHAGVVTAELRREGVSAYLKGDYKHAISTLEQALADDRTHWKSLCCLALSYCHDLQWEFANETFNYLSESCTDELLKARSARALTLVQQMLGDSVNLAAKAETAGLEGAAPAEPKLAPPANEEERQRYCKWGVNCYLNAKHERAIEYLELGLTGDTENHNARLCLGMSYYKTGQFEPAKNILNDLIQNCPDNKIRMRARQALDSVLNTEQFGDELPTHFDGSGIAPRVKRKAEPSSAPQLVYHEQSEEATAKPRRKPHPLSYAVLALGLIAVAYYGAMLMLPRIYTSLLIPPSLSAVSVQTFGKLSGIDSRTVEVSASLGNKLYGVYYGKQTFTKVVIINPGIANDAEYRKKIAAGLLQKGIAVFLYDLRGTGGSGGTTSWQTIADDGLFMYDCLIGKFGFDPENIYSYGSSWGSAAAIQTGCRREHGLVLVENSFCSIPALARAKMPALMIFPDAVCPEPHVDLVAMLCAKAHPQILVVDSKDALVPDSECHALFDKASEPKEFQDFTSASDDARVDAVVNYFSK